MRDRVYVTGATGEAVAMLDREMAGERAA